MHRYIAFICSNRRQESISVLDGISALFSRLQHDWSVRRLPGMVIANRGERRGFAEVYPLDNQSGIVLGAVFRTDYRNGGARPPAIFDVDETRRILDTKCQHLVDHYWGKYVALVRNANEDAYYVLRDPICQMRCYHASWNGMDVIFSNVEDFVRFVPLPVSINWKRILSGLLSEVTAASECGLNEIDEVPGGERLTLSQGKRSRVVLWKPADICRRGFIEKPIVAANALRSTVQEVVDVLGSCFDRIVLSLSGGLDSSIVAGCLGLSTSRQKVSCLNHFIALGLQDEKIALPGISIENRAKLRRVAGNADERQFARLVCRKWGYPLVEHERCLNHIKLAQVFDAPISLAPGHFVGTMDVDEAEISVAQETGADAFFTGQGGDTVLYATFQSVGAIDYVHRHGLGPRVVEEIANACLLSRESIWRVLGKAFCYGLLHRPMPRAYDALKRSHLLTDRSSEWVAYQDMGHHGFDQGGRLPPGKGNQVFGVEYARLVYNQEFARERHAVTVNPLMAQPVVEVCLQIPTYVLLFGGVSRGLARHAFADSLPLEIQQRVVKGTGSPFYQRLVRTNLKYIREILLSGVLVQEKILDSKKLESYLVDGQQFLTVTAPQLLNYLATEAWLRQWFGLMQLSLANKDALSSGYLGGSNR